jgi:hypothetical protein
MHESLMRMGIFRMPFGCPSWGENGAFESIVSYGSAGFHRKNTGNPVDFRCFCLYQRINAGSQVRRPAF